MIAGCDDEQRQLIESLYDGKVVGLESIAMIVQVILREYIWCEILCEQNLNIALRFGYDYYMYWNGEPLSSQAKKRLGDLGLFIE